MPKTLSFEEVTRPRKISFEDAQNPLLPLPPISQYYATHPDDGGISFQQPALELLAPDDFPGPAGIPRIPSLGREGSALRGASEFAGGAQESVLGGLSSMTSREGMLTYPLFSLPYIGPALGLVLGSKLLGEGGGEFVHGIEQGEPRVAGAGAGKSVLSLPLLLGGGKGAKEHVIGPDPREVALTELAREKALQASLPQVGEGRIRHQVPENIYQVGGLNRPQAMPVVSTDIWAKPEPQPTPKGTVPAKGLPEPTPASLPPAEEVIRGETFREPSGLELQPETLPVEAKGGVAAPEGALGLLPTPTIEQLAINELLRGESAEMRQLIEAEGKAVERTGEALPQPADVAEPVPLGQPKQPEIVAGTIAPEGLPKLPTVPKPQATVPLGEMNIPAVPESSGLRMAADALPETAKGGAKAVADMLDLLPEGELKEVAMNELTRQGVERGEALRRVEALGDAMRRVTDFAKARAEATGQAVTGQIAEGIINEVHPGKPMTENQLRITKASLVKALTENRLSEDRPGIVSGSRLEAWADRTIAEGRGRVSAGIDPVQLAAYAVKGVALLERGITDIAKWTAEMVKAFGKEVTPYLKDIRKQSEALRAATFTASQKAEAKAEPPATPAPAPETATSALSRAARPLPSTSAAEQSAFTRSMNNLAQDIKALFQRRGVKRDMAQLADALIDTIPANKGWQAGTELRVLSRSVVKGKVVDNKLARKAVVFVVQAGGDRGKLATDLVKVQGNKDAEAAVRYAQANWNALQPLAARTKLLFDEQIAYEQGNGIDTNYENHYVPQRHENLLTDRGVLFGETGGGIAGTSFKKAKVFPDYASAIQAGYKPRNLDIADLVEHRVRSGQRLVNKKLWAEGFKGVADPYSSDPVMTDLITRKIQRPDGTTDTQFSAPQGYAVKEIIPGVRIAVRQGYGHLFNALTGTSQIRESAVGRAALTSAGWLKHKLLLLDSFHAVRTMETSLASRGSAGYNRGLSVLEYSDRALRDAVQRKLVTPEMAKWVQTPQPFEIGGKTLQLTPRTVLQIGMRNGLNVGRFADALYNDAKGTVGTNPFSKWLFEKLTRGAMAETFMSEFARVGKANPELSLNAVAKQVARDVNVIFGNLQRQSIIKNPAIRDLMQIAFLAPQWVESLARRELRAVGQTAEAVVSGARGKGVQLGTAAKTVGTGLAAYVAVTQALNYITRGHSTLENKEEGHKLDAFIPDPLGGSEGFWFSPLAVFAEVTHDLLRYSHTEPTKIGAAARIVQNKLGPIGRALSIVASQEDTIGTKLPSSWDVASEAGFAAVPLPIGAKPIAQEIANRVSGGKVPAPKPGTITRQIASSVGQKIEPYNKDEAQIKRAREVNLYIDYWKKHARQLPLPERGKYLMSEMKKSGLNGAEGKKAVREFHEAGLFIHP